MLIALMLRVLVLNVIQKLDPARKKGQVYLPLFASLGENDNGKNVKKNEAGAGKGVSSLSDKVS